MQAVLVVLVVSAALVAGAAWGVFGRLTDRSEGFVVAMAGGALMVSAVLELILPATRETTDWAAYLVVMIGASVFVVLDRLVKRRLGGAAGAGLLLAITLDGIPENLALGVALIGAAPLEVAALSGAIFLSNLPEAAGGARGMVHDGDLSRARVMGVWAATAGLLAAAASVGYFLLEPVPSGSLALVRCFAGGAVVASLATEVFPGAFREDSYQTGIAAAAGLVLAMFLTSLG
jgi:ZIP family zinc transporter